MKRLQERARRLASKVHSSQDFKFIIDTFKNLQILYCFKGRKKNIYVGLLATFGTALLAFGTTKWPLVWMNTSVKIKSNDFILFQIIYHVLGMAFLKM